MTDKLKPVPFGLAAGILWGLAILIIGLASAVTGYGGRFIDVVGSFYLGYVATIPGSIIGGIWGFFDALIAGAIFAWVYNYLSGIIKK